MELRICIDGICRSRGTDLGKLGCAGTVRLEFVPDEQRPDRIGGVQRQCAHRPGRYVVRTVARVLTETRHDRKHISHWVGQRPEKLGHFQPYPVVLCQLPDLEQYVVPSFRSGPLTDLNGAMPSTVDEQGQLHFW